MIRLKEVIGLGLIVGIIFTGYPTGNRHKDNNRAEATENTCTNTKREEFDSLDLNYWSKQVHEGPSCTKMVEENVNIGDGRLELTVDPIDPPDGEMKAEGGEIRSKSLHRYGSYRAKMKAAEGPHVISSFFTFKTEAECKDPNGTYPNHEIDIEILMCDGVWEVWFVTWTHVNERYPSCNKVNTHCIRGSDLGFDPNAAFHEYGFDWNIDKVIFYIDGNAKWTSTLHIPDKPSYVMANAWNSCSWCNPDAEAPEKTTVYCIDYILLPSGSVILVPAEYPTIQAGIDAALPGDIVLVADGAYTGVGNKDLDFKGKAITVASENGPKSCIIDCERSGRGFFFQSGEGKDCVLSGLTVQNGEAELGSGILCSASSPTIENCIVSGNSATSAGGGIFCWSSSPTIKNCAISGNSSTGAYGGGGIYCNSSSPSIIGCTISDNSVTGSDYGGGGICCLWSSSPSISNCTISRNSADGLAGGGAGGGIYCYESSPSISSCIISQNGTFEGGGIYCWASSPSITNCTISDNMSTCGGGIFCHSSSPGISSCSISGNGANNGGGVFCFYSSPSITNCTISGNWVCLGGGVFCSYSSPSVTNCTISGNGATCGGGVYCDSSSPTINNCAISGNSATSTYGGGGIYCNSSSPSIVGCTISDNSAELNGGGISCLWSSSPSITNCTISQNKASQGGGIYCFSSSPGISNCTISGNSADLDGGGVVCTESSPRIVNCIIINNSAGYGSLSGGGICCSGLSSPTIINCTITGNSANNGGGAIQVWDSSPAIINSILWNDSPNEISVSFGGTPIVTYSDIHDGYPGEGNIDADPKFVNSATEDFHLLFPLVPQSPFGSPCIDTGTNAGSPDHDNDGRERPIDGDHNGSYLCDMGAYEAEGPTLIKSDQFSAVPQGNQITITWSTLSEIDNAGFNLWRSEAKDGKYTMINFKIIEAEGGATLKAEYSYSDNTAKAGVTYYYKLEDIDTRGNSTFHGPVSAMISWWP